jgi:hypothetical protein
MPGKSPRVNPLAARKRLLIAESELNRAQMVGDLSELADGVRTMASRAKSIGAITASVAALIAGLAVIPRGKPSEGAAGSSWLHRFIKGAGLAASLWSAFRSHRT